MSQIAFKRLFTDLKDFQNTEYVITYLDKSVLNINTPILDLNMFEKIIIRSKTNEFVFFDFFDYPFVKPNCVITDLSTNKKTFYPSNGKIGNDDWSPVITLFNYIKMLEHLQKTNKNITY